jgi:hypothetical protein
MHDNVLLLADGTEEAMRVLRLAALYAEKVHVLSPAKASSLELLHNSYEAHISRIDQIARATLNDHGALKGVRTEAEMATQMSQLVGTARFKPLLQVSLQYLYANQFASYLKRTNAYQPEVAKLESAGVVYSLADYLLDQWRTNGDDWHKQLELATELLKQTGLEDARICDLPKLYQDDSFDRPATSCVLVELALQGLIQAARDIPEIRRNDEVPYLSPEQTRIFATLVYFHLSAVYALQNGCVGMTWDEGTRSFFDNIVEAAQVKTSALQRVVAKRESIKNQLGELVLTSTVPDVSRLPIDNILELREKRGPELQWFRASLRKLAADIDPSLEGEQLAASLLDALDKEVHPALHQLRASLDIADSKAMSKLLTVNPQQIAGMISFGISAAFGVPFDPDSYLGAVGVAASKLFGFTAGRELEKQMELRSSPWSVIFYMDQSMK